MALDRAQKEKLLDRYDTASPSAARLPDRLPGDHGHRRSTELRAKVRAAGGQLRGGEEHAWRCAPSRARRSRRFASTSTGPRRSPTPSSDPVALAKALTEFAKTPQSSSGAASSRASRSPPTRSSRSPSCPSREELIAKLLFLLQSPITRFVRTLAAIPREFVVVLDQVAKQKEASSRPQEPLARIT